MKAKVNTKYLIDIKPTEDKFPPSEILVKEFSPSGIFIKFQYCGEKKPQWMKVDKIHFIEELPKKETPKKPTPNLQDLMNRPSQLGCPECARRRALTERAFPLAPPYPQHPGVWYGPATAPPVHEGPWC